MTVRSFIAFASLAIMAVLIGRSVGFVLYSAWDLPEVQALEHFKPSITTRVYSDSSELLAEFFVENRTPVQLADVPDVFLKALIATEDTRFYSHSGLDYRGIARVFLRNVRAGKVLEGGSTLTQQLAKVLFLTPERSYLRKIKEMALALKIEQRYTKQEILTLYLNQIYFRSGAYGIEAASLAYFGKQAKDLDLAECALRVIEYPDEKREVLHKLIDKYFKPMQIDKDYRAATDKELRRPSVYEVSIESWSGKENWKDRADQSGEWPALDGQWFLEG